MAMQEKHMVCDVLSMTKASMSDYTTSIGECSNQSLRTALTQLRSEAEHFQDQLAQIATQKGYYPTSQPATAKDKQELKSQLSQGV